MTPSPSVVPAQWSHVECPLWAARAAGSVPGARRLGEGEDSDREEGLSCLHKDGI